MPLLPATTITGCHLGLSPGPHNEDPCKFRTSQFSACGRRCPSYLHCIHDTSILATDSDPAVALHLLQTALLAIQQWLKRWRMKVNETKSTHVDFTTLRATCPPVKINDVQLPQSDEVKYLGLHLDRRLTWHKHNFTKRKQLGLTLTKMHWLPTLHHQQTTTL
jgi:hypothetical protein